MTTTLDPAAGTSAGTGTEAGQWQAFHIFYSASPRPLLLQCVEPLVDALTAESLISGHFFINYWLEGAHVRLRLKPSRPDAAEEVRQRSEAAIAEFLRKRPALYEVPPGYLDDYYEKLFALEYSQEERRALLGPDGIMRLRQNNTFSAEPYEPEYAKYGGPGGVALAEWHFQHSSELVLAANRTLNLHLRTVSLGFAAQLMMVMSACLIQDPDELLRFLDAYHAFWTGASSDGSVADTADFDRAYDSAGASMAPRFRRVLEAVAQDDFSTLPRTQRHWAEHCRELRGRILDRARSGDLVFDAQDGPAADPVTALPRLLVPYLHMTNNRLSMSIQDEAYLAYALARVLREPQQPLS
jgi:thiopeptide-type bacteriocin biosynthesis protein